MRSARVSFLIAHGTVTRAAESRSGKQEMAVILLNALAAVVVVVIVLSVWVTIHLVSRKRLGERTFSCRGGVRQADGRITCCQGEGESCKAQREAE